MTWLTGCLLKIRAKLNFTSGAVFANDGNILEYGYSKVKISDLASVEWISGTMYKWNIIKWGSATYPSSLNSEQYLCLLEGLALNSSSRQVNLYKVVSGSGAYNVRCIQN